MKRQKRFAALLLAAAVCVGMVGCGDGGDKGSAGAGASDQGQDAGAEAAGADKATGTEAGGSGGPAGGGDSSWPGDTVSLYVPATAGGGTDMAARLFSQGMAEVNGANYIVVNDTTGGGSVAAEQVRNASPDGLTLLAYHTGLCTSIASGQYAHGLDEFQMLGLFITEPEFASAGVFVPGNSQFNTLEELVDYAKEHPGELLSGIQQGSSSQLITAMLEKSLEIESTYVDVGSNADKVTALMGNQIDWVMMNTTGNDQYVKSGDLKCLMQFGIVGCERADIFPDVPTLGEIYPEVDKSMPRLSNIGYIAGPLGMSEADIAEISRVIKGAVETATVQDGYAQMGMVVEYYTVEDAAAVIAEQQEAYIEAYKLVNGQ